jgi:hypothetical protein
MYKEKHMIEIKLSEKEEINTKCVQNNFDFYENIMLYIATDSNIMNESQSELGYCLFEIKGNASKILKININSQDMIFIADGVLRTTINYLLDHNITQATYEGSEYLKLFKKLGFIEQDGLFTLDICEDVFKKC